jgi:hypothetical protein
VYDDVQLELLGEACTSGQLAPGVNEPPALELRATLPVGALAVPASVSVTVATQLVALAAVSEPGVQETTVVVERVDEPIRTVPVLWPWLVSPAYVAVTCWLPPSLGVNVTEQADWAGPVNTNVQLALEPNEPLPLDANVTSSPGALWTPAASSPTVAVHVVAVPAVPVAGWQSSAVDVARRDTSTACLSVEAAKVDPSPP